MSRLPGYRHAVGASPTFAGMTVLFCEVHLETEQLRLGAWMDRAQGMIDTVDNPLTRRIPGVPDGFGWPQIPDNRPRDPGSLDRSIFVDPDIYAEEQEKVFGRAWLMIGHESLVPRNNDYFHTYMGEEPVILCRDGRGNLRAFLNMCRSPGQPHRSHRHRQRSKLRVRRTTVGRSRTKASWNTSPARRRRTTGRWSGSA